VHLRSTNAIREAAGRALPALPVIIYLWKVIVWDKVLGLGTTDAIAGDVAQWAGAIVTTLCGWLACWSDVKSRTCSPPSPCYRSPTIPDEPTAGTGKPVN
jgi:hypothetical protein